MKTPVSLNRVRRKFPMAAAEKIEAAIRTRRCVAFTYNGRRRFVEPQTLGLSAMRKLLLRGYERMETDGALKLFELAKMEGLHLTKVAFRQARPGHNPHDSAMSPVIVSLPPPE